MDPQIRNFSELEKFIRENPRVADEQAFKWRQFLKNNAATSPELLSIETLEEFYKWAKEHPEKNIDTSVWVGKEISDSYYYLRELHEDEQMRTEGKVDISQLPADLLGLPLLGTAFFEKPKIMEHDKYYQKIEENLKKEWLNKNPGKDFLSKEGIDYLYGSLDDPSKQSLAKEAENSFRNNPKFKKRIERYDKEKKKIYKNPKDDPNLRLHESITETHTNTRLEYLKTQNDAKTSEEMTSLVLKKSQEDFASKFPEKTKVYALRIEGLQKAQEKAQINESLATYAADSGKDIRYVEKKHREPSSISVEDATKILEGIFTPQENPFHAIGSPLKTENQTPQPSSSDRPSGGGINRGINAINQLAQSGIKNPLSSLIAANPWIWAILAILIIVVTFTFVIVMGFGGAPPSETNFQIVPTALPTESVTPTPVAP